MATETNNNMLAQYSRLGITLKLKILKERLLAAYQVLLLPAHHRFFNSFNEKFKLMLEAGLFNQYIEESMYLHIAHAQEQPEEPFKVLTLDELEAGFIVCMVPLLLTLVVFCLEWIVTLKDLVVVLCMFEACFKAKQQEMDVVIESKTFKERFWRTLQTIRAQKTSVREFLDSD